MLNQIYYNNTIQSWLTSAIIIFAALMVNWLISFINQHYLKPLAKRTKSQVISIIVNSLETPLKVGIVLIAIWTAFNRLEMSKSFDNVLFKVYEILTVLNITWFVAHLAGRLLNEYFVQKDENESTSQQGGNHDTHFVSLLKKILTFLIWIVGLITALNNAGLDLKAILGTLGIGGIAIALAAQDTVKNVFGGFTILLDGTFRIGDRVIIGEHDGIVEDIGVRSTKIRNFDQRLITIPNYKVVDDPVINVAAAPEMRIINNLGIVYDASPEKMRRALHILTNIAQSHDGVSKDGISATFESFGDFALKIRFCYFIIDPGQRFEVCSSINLAILQKFNDEGIAFAFPTQTLYIDQGKA